MKEEIYFSYSFCIQVGNIRKIQFEVSYFRLGGNEHPDFSTQASVMNQTRTDIKSGGQCQKRVLPQSSLVYKFYEKWDKKHLQALNEDEMKEVLSGIEELKNVYDYVSIIDGNCSITFGMEVELQRKNEKSLELYKTIKGFNYKIHKK